MTKSKRRQTPAQILADLQRTKEKNAERQASARMAERDPETWGVNAPALALKVNAEAYGMDGQNRAGEPRPVRKDIFAELYDRRQGSDRKGPRCLEQDSFDAVRRLETAMVARLGLGETPDATGGRGFGPRTLVNDRMLDAGDEVSGVLALLERKHAGLLLELIEPKRVHTAAPQRWRLVVALITGTKGEGAQADRVREAAEGLARAFIELDRLRASEGWRPRRAA